MTNVVFKVGRKGSGCVLVLAWQLWAGLPGTATAELFLAKAEVADAGTDTQTISSRLGIPVATNIHLKWEFSTGGVVRSSPALGTNGLVYFGSADAKIYALDAATGTERWHVTAPSPVLASPAIAPDGAVFIGSTDGTLFALDGATGGHRWTKQINGVLSSPAIGANGLVYVAGVSDGLHAFDAATGKERWSATLPNWQNVYASPVIGAGGTVFCASGGLGDFGSPRRGVPEFFAVDGETGRVRWSFDSVNLIQSTPALGEDGVVYIPSYDKLLHALDANTGIQKWSYLTGDSMSSSPALGPDGTLFVGANDGRLYALDSVTGTLKWTFLTGDTIHSSPALGNDGVVYFGSYDRNVYAIDAKTGMEKWRFKTGGLVLSSPVISPEGLVLIGSYDNKLYALQGGAAAAAEGWPAFKGNAQRSGSAERPGPPVVIQRPGSTQALVGASTFLDVVVQGSRPMHFQWFTNNQAVLHGTNASLDIPAAQENDAADYMVVASNALGETRAYGHLDVGYRLTIKPEGGGGVTLSSSQDLYLPGTVVELTASPLGPRQFLGWHGDAAGSENPFRMVMNGHKLVAAQFETFPGDRMWDTAAAVSTLSPPAIDEDNTIYAGDSTTNLIALDARTGLAKWTFPTGGFNRTAAALGPDGLLVFVGEPSLVYGLDSATGMQRWKLTGLKVNLTRPAIAPSGMVYLSSDDNSSSALLAVDGASGALTWRFNTGGNFFGSGPVVGTNGLVYITTADPPSNDCSWKLTAVDAATGAGRWSAGHQCAGSTPVLGGNNSVYTLAADGVLNALDGSTGSNKWALRLSSPVSGRPFIVGPDETIYLISTGSAVAVDGITGQIKSGFKVKDVETLAGATPALALDGTLYATSFYRLLALDSVSGQLRWDVFIPNLYDAPLTIGPDGAVYAATAYNEPHLIAVKGTSPMAEGPWPVVSANSRNTSALADVLPIRVLAVQLSADAVQVTVRTRAGRSHHLEFNESMNKPHWTEVATLVGNGSEQILVDLQAMTSARFYRVRVE